MRLTREKFFDHEEYKRILYAARTRPHVHAKRDFALFAVAGMSGARVSELLGTRIGDFVLSAEPPFVRVERRKQRERVIHEVSLPPYAAKAMGAYLRSLEVEQREPWRRAFPLTPRQANRLTAMYCKIAGLTMKHSFHAFRHYRGLSLYEETKDLELVREALGHRNLASTQVYVHTLNHMTKSAAVGLPVDFEDGPPT